MNKLIPDFFTKNKKSVISLLLMAFAIAIFSFPEIDLSYTIGIDPPLKWLFNHIFNTSLNMGNGIIFPHGPLALFMYPLQENFILSVIVTMLLQITFVFQLFFLINKTDWKGWALTAIISLFIFGIANFNLLISSNISIAFLLYLRNEKQCFKYWGFLLFIFAFYVKAYIAIISGTFIFSALAIEFWNKKDFKQTLSDIGIILSGLIIFWIILYGTLSGFINYCIGMIQLAGDNSAGAAVHPSNNWIYLLIFLIVIFGLPFIQKNKEGKLFGFLFLLSFYAVWKYGMAREDFAHFKVLLYFSTVSYILFLIFNKKWLIINISIIALALVLLTLNIRNIPDRKTLTFNYSGIINFSKFVGSYSEIKSESEQIIAKNIQSKKLTEDIRKQIGDATVDIYPWDYSIIAANKLNWKARPVIQSYAVYTSKLDERNAKHFKSEEAPEYLIWDIQNNKANVNGTLLGSIDNRYLLNDEPQTIIEILKNYESIYSDSKFTVYKKRNKALNITSNSSKPNYAKWHEWIDVPDSANYLTRMKVELQNSFSGKLISTFYKDGLYYIYLKTKSNKTLKYRIVPKNASDGIWLSPHFTDLMSNEASKEIKQIMFVCSNSSFVKPRFSYKWEYFNANQKNIEEFFNKEIQLAPNYELQTSIDFEQIDTALWENFNPKKVINYSYYKQKAYRVEPGKFSPTFVFNTDSLSQVPAILKLACWIKTFKGSKASLVIEIIPNEGKKIWHGTDAMQQVININELNHIFNYHDINYKNCEIKAYLWNNGKKSVMIYDMAVDIVSKFE